MDQRLDQRLVGILQHRVLAHYGDGHLAVRVRQPLGDAAPARQVGRGRVVDAEVVQHLRVQPLPVVVQRHGVDAGAVPRLDHRTRPHVAEQRDLALLALRNRLLAAAQQDVGLDAYGAQLAHAVLRGLGLHLAGGLDEGQERQVDEAGVAAG